MFDVFFSSEEKTFPVPEEKKKLKRRLPSLFLFTLLLFLLLKKRFPPFFLFLLLKKTFSVVHSLYFLLISLLERCFPSFFLITSLLYFLFHLLLSTIYLTELSLYIFSESYLILAIFILLSSLTDWKNNSHQTCFQRD